MDKGSYSVTMIKTACSALAREFNPRGIHVLPVSEYNELIAKFDEAHERAEHFEEEARQYRKKVLELIGDNALTDLRLSLQGLVSPQDGPRPGFEYLDVDTNTAMLNSINRRKAKERVRRHPDAKLGRQDAGKLRR